MGSLPEKRDPRDKVLSVKIQETVFKQLKKLSKDTGLSQPDIVEHLIEAAYQEHIKKKKKK